MERLEVRYEDAKRAIGTLIEIIHQPFSIIVRDAAIQRFEYTFEAFWKFIKDYLRIKEGVVCNSPKSCFRELFTIGIIKEDETIKLLEMTDDRNMTSHTYKEEVAKIIYGKLKEYAELMEDIIERFKI
ncbi:MAG: HI0074 family nucleotidyltransferase substrate-binding subunit [Thermodesulfovibrionales bacterium]